MNEISKQHCPQVLPQAIHRFPVSPRNPLGKGHGLRRRSFLLGSFNPAKPSTRTSAIGYGLTQLNCPLKRINPTVALVAACGRSDPLPCPDACGIAGDTRCVGEMLQTCTPVDPRCQRWQDTTDCAQYNRFCQENDHGASCVKACTDDCIPEGASRCNGDVVQTCTHDERGCLSWISIIDCDAFGETCEEKDGLAHCAVTCQNECTELGATMCGGTCILTCARPKFPITKTSQQG